MIWTAVINPDGFVIRWVSGPVENVPLNAGESGYEHEGSPPAGRWRLAGGQLVSAPIVEPIEQSIVRGEAVIDDAAGRARLRYITDIPGQQATYTRKEQQAREWAAAGFTGAAPSFIAAEAAALGIGAQLLAEQVIALADYWAEVKGPEIEAARIKHKAAIRAATTEADVRAVCELALAELGAM